MGPFPSHPLPIRRSESGSLRAPPEPTYLSHQPLPAHLQILIPQPEASSWTTTAGAASIGTFHKTSRSQGVWDGVQIHRGPVLYTVEVPVQSWGRRADPKGCVFWNVLSTCTTSSCPPFIKALERTEEEPRPKRSPALETV